MTSPPGCLYFEQALLLMSGLSVPVSPGFTGAHALESDESLVRPRADATLDRWFCRAKPWRRMLWT